MPKSLASEGMTSGRRPSILECDVRHVRMPSILQLVEAEMYTGRITFAPGGVIAVRSGAVVAASTDSGLSGVAAMHELFLTSEGSCRIDLDASVEGNPLASTIGLILDGCKLLDEWNELAGERLLFAAQTMVLTPELQGSLDAMRHVLEAMRDRGTLREAVAATGAQRSKVVQHIMRLIEAGVVDLPRTSSAHVPLSLATDERPLVAAVPTARTQRVQAPDAAVIEVAAPPPLPTEQAADEARPALVTRETRGAAEELGDIDELVTRARNLIRSNMLDDAERLLRAALERSPNDRVLAQNMRHLALRRMQQSA